MRPAPRAYPWLAVGRAPGAWAQSLGSTWFMEDFPSGGAYPNHIGKVVEGLGSCLYSVLRVETATVASLNRSYFTVTEISLTAPGRRGQPRQAQYSTREVSIRAHVPGLANAPTMLDSFWSRHRSAWVGTISRWVVAPTSRLSM